MNTLPSIAIENLKEVNKLLPPATFTKNDTYYELLKYSDKTALYVARTDKGHIIGYEVHILRYNKERAIRGVKISANVRLASDKDFGKYAWYITNETTANKKYNTLLNEKGAL